MDVHISIMYIYILYIQIIIIPTKSLDYLSNAKQRANNKDLDLSDVINTHQINIGVNCVKNVRIGSFSAPYFPAFGRNVSLLGSVRMRENRDQKNSKYGHFSRSNKLNRFCAYISFVDTQYFCNLKLV